MIYQWAKKIFFLFDPEIIHRGVFFLFRWTPGLCLLFMKGIKRDARFAVKGHSMSWDFPVGIAAGLDKEACGFNFLWRLGIGAIEVGTVTPRPQKGNQKPRLFRLIKEESLRNHMGFPNEGAQKILPRVLKKKKELVGVNIGKNSDTSSELVPKDYLFLYQCFKSSADYIVINISCPNVKNLTQMQQGDGLEIILRELEGHRNQKPLFVKVGPDLTLEQLDHIIEVARQFKLAGIVATNTMSDERLGLGGISGRLLFEKARKTRHYLLEKSGGDLDIIGAGGFFSFDDVWEFLERGGRFVQIYSSFIYKGPEILKEVQRGLRKKMVQAGVDCVEELLSTRR